MANNIKIKLTIPISYDKLNDNGCIFTKEAVEDAVKNLQTKLPIMFKDRVIGATTGKTYVTTWDNENQVCNLTIDGVIFNGGFECTVEVTGNKVTSMKIDGLYVTNIDKSTFNIKERDLRKNSNLLEDKSQSLYVVDKHFDDHDSETYAHCPVCNQVVKDGWNGRDNVCPKCNQTLKW